MSSTYLETLEYAERWRTMVLSAENPQALDWVKRTCERKGYMTPELQALIEKQERKIEEGHYAIRF